MQIFVLILEMYVKNIFKVKLFYYSQTNLYFQLDEIHMKSNVVYQNGKLIGHAENQSVKSANRIQCFMSSSIIIIEMWFHLYLFNK